MRQVGKLPNEQHAARFADFLQSEGISVETEEEAGEWAIWVRDENQVETASEELEKFRNSPDDAKYRDARRKAEELRREEQKRREKVNRNTVEMRQRWGRPSWQRRPLTTVLIVLCVIVGVLTNFGRPQASEERGQPGFATQVTNKLLLVDPVHYWQTGNLFIDIQRGEVWRLFTPNVLHGSLMHLVMNMLALSFLAGMIEERRGTLVLASLVLILASPPIIGEYLATESRALSVVGISGVLFGLFGYLWMKSLFDPAAGIHLPPNLVIFVMAWFLLGATGVLARPPINMHIANWAHGVGLVIGIAAGYLPTLVRGAPGR